MSVSSVRICPRTLIGGVLLACLGCVTPYDYTAYRAQMPRSILVLPPLNESLDANASYSYVTTISKPLAERGYYVFPVAVVDQFMKDNGLPTPGEMHGVSLAKIDEIIGPDAVLYITVEEFSQKYLILSSNTTVRARAFLVDVESGNQLWDGSVNVVLSSGGGGDPIAAIIVAAVEQVVDRVTDQTHIAAGMANDRLINNANNGLLVGPLHPEFGETD